MRYPPSYLADGADSVLGDQHHGPRSSSTKRPTQPKDPLNLKAIERIVTLEVQKEAIGASSSGARAPRPARPTQTCATITNWPEPLSDIRHSSMG